MSGPAARATPDGALLAVRVAPGAKRDRIVGAHGKALKVSVQAPPEKGRANRAVAKLLAEACGARPAEVEVVRGATSRDKTVLFKGWDAARLDRKIAALLVTLGPR